VFDLLWICCTIHKSTYYAVVSSAVIACSALQFLCNNYRVFNVMENIPGCDIFASGISIFHHVGKPAITAQKLQRVACSKLRMKPWH